MELAGVAAPWGALGLEAGIGRAGGLLSSWALLPARYYCGTARPFTYSSRWNTPAQKGAVKGEEKRGVL